MWAWATKYPLLFTFFVAPALLTIPVALIRAASGKRLTAWEA